MASTATGEQGSLSGGVAVIRDTVRRLPPGPGVYRMLDAKGGVLYVGKARALRKRVASYANPLRQSVRIARMIAETASLEVITTHTEAEALLLEANLIKRLKPRYNIVLRDDKSHPYILLTGDNDWPHLLKHRGARSKPGRYFGPFASAGAVNRTLNALQRAFPLRTCSDSVFKARSRPCLQYQIKRCSGPCVGNISAEDYGEIVAQTGDFLAGRSQQVQSRLAERMQAASDDLAFEAAAVLRDRIRALAHIQAHQGINVDALGDADLIAAHQDGGQTCIQVFFFRGGRNYGNRAHYPSHGRDDDTAKVLGAFVAQFYDGREAPPRVLLSHQVEGQALIGEALSLRAERRVHVTRPQRGDKRRLVDQAVANAREALARRLAESATQRRLLDGVAEMFALEAPPQRIEVYDNSHISGTRAVGAMVVAGPEGPIKGAYRKFNIKGSAEGGGSEGFAPGDDYAMMREVLTRRFTRLNKEDPDGEGGQWPDLVLLDGGAGQLSGALATFADLGVTVGEGGIGVAAIAKGPERDAGRERIHLPDRQPFLVPPNSPVSYFLQRLRDEAHRFAIGSHRARRAKALVRSELDQIAGIGAKRKRALLHRFGSPKGVAEAGLADLETVQGISKTVAKTIYDHFHGGG
jgi:excinuclease ABC subunit C